MSLEREQDSKGRQSELTSVVCLSAGSACLLGRSPREPETGRSHGFRQMCVSSTAQLVLRDEGWSFSLHGCPDELQDSLTGKKAPCRLEHSLSISLVLNVISLG